MTAAGEEGDSLPGKASTEGTGSVPLPAGAPSPDSPRGTISCRHLWMVFGEDVRRRFEQGTPSTGEDARRHAASLREDGAIVGVMDANLEIGRGEFFVLMGLSGSGKSTLLRCLSRLCEPTAGEVVFDGRDLLAMSEKELMSVRREKMGMVFQHFGLFPHMTVLENVAFPLKVQGVPLSQREETARKMVGIVGLEGRDASYPCDLSGGQKQRVGIARSLAVDPELWFLDEPFSALDPMIRWQMQSELLRLQNMFHKTVVFVTHDFMEAVRLADRIAIMKDGEIVQVGTASEIVLSPANGYVAEFVREAPRAKIIRVGQLLGTDGAGGGAAPPGDALTADMTLEDALSWSARRSGELPVVDGSGAVVGRITPDTLAKALDGGAARDGE